MGCNIAFYSRLLLIILPVIAALIMLIKILYGANNNKYNIDTKPLRLFKFVSKITYQPIKEQILSFVDFLKRYKWIYKLWIVIWIFNLNFAAIIISALA